jgi:hypothetical protein
MLTNRRTLLVAVASLTLAAACGPTSAPFAPAEPDTPAAPTSKLHPHDGANLSAFDITPPDGPCSDCGTPWNPPPPGPIAPDTTGAGGPPIQP